MAINKIIYHGSTLIDLTSDTVNSQFVASGKKMHLANGEIAYGAIPLIGVNEVRWTESNSEYCMVKNPFYGKTNVFNINDCSVEQNVTSFTRNAYGTNSGEFIVNSLEKSSIYFTLNPAKVYDVAWRSVNCGLDGYNSSWHELFNIITGDGYHEILNMHNVEHLYFYTEDITKAAIFTNVLITECT